MHRLAPCLILLTTCACSAAALARASAEPTACPESQIEISDAHRALTPTWWTATCKAPGAEPREWFCERMGDRVICVDVPR